MQRRVHRRRREPAQRPHPMIEREPQDARPRQRWRAARGSAPGCSPLGLVSSCAHLRRVGSSPLGTARRVAAMRSGWIAAGALAIAVGWAPGAARAASACNLGPNGQIKHVVVLQFDNTHLARDASGVPSDLEQMPALKSFLESNGSLLSNDHTILISHTAGGIVSTETGLYPDRNGLTVTNSYEFFDKLASTGVNFSSAFKYWTDPTGTNDPLPMMITSGQKVTPAPWVAFTRAGCDFAGVGAADMELENTTSDVTQVFGTGSPEAALGTYSAAQPAGSAGRNLALTDLEGIAVHCSLQSSAPGGACAGGGPDALPDEPGGYNGFKGLFGTLHVNPFITGQPATALAGAPGTPVAPPVYDIFAPNATNSGPNAAPVANHPAQTTPPPASVTGATTSVIEDGTANPGFPGFDAMEANNALGYTAALQEAGVPVTYTYLSDIHDDHYRLNHSNAFGPGEAGAEAQLREYNAAFQAFFARLGNDGITKANTVFLVTVDEGDHYAGGQALNPGCDGASTPCQYDTAEAGGAAFGTAGFHRNVGEADVNLPALVKGATGDATTFGQDFDDAPTIFVPNQADKTAAPPGPNDPAVRKLERELGSLTEYDPIDGGDHRIADDIADQTTEGILHMVNSDPARTPTFTMFGDPDFFFQTSCATVGAQQGQTPAPVTDKGPGCPAQGPGFAWNHGDEQPEIATTWQGWVGPGIRNLGQSGAVWTDHTDARPTLMTLLGLRDDYDWDGRAIAEIADAGALPAPIAADPADFLSLSPAYKQLDASFGRFALGALHYDTGALATNTAGDSAYQAATSQLSTCLAQRDALVPQIRALLQGAETDGKAVDPAQARALTARANALVNAAEALASGGTPSYAVCNLATTATTAPSGTVPATLSLTLGAPASFSPFTPGVAKEYLAGTTANVISTAGDATLSVADPSTVAPGHLVNGTFTLPSPLQAQASSPAGTSGAFAPLGTLLTYGASVSNDPVTLAFKQSIAANDALRTGTYSKTLTFTLSTTTP